MPNNILRLPEVKCRVGLSRSSIYQAVSTGTFPKPIKLGVRAVGWMESDVETWIQSRKAKGEASTAALRVRNPAPLNRPPRAMPFGQFGRVLR